MKDILENLEILLKKSKSLNESTEPDDIYADVDPDFSTADQGVRAAAEQIKNRIFGGKGDGLSDKSKMEEDDTPGLPKLKRSAGGGVDKTFKSTKIDDDDLSDVDSIDDEDDGDENDDELEDEDFEFDDFDYDDSSSGMGGDDEGDDDGNDEYEDGDFDDSEIGDEDDYDFGDDGGLSSTSTSSSDLSGTKGSSGSVDGKDVDYEDTLDYDAEDYDTLESEINDALNRISGGTKNKSVKNSIEKMKDDFNEKDGKSSVEKAKELSDKIDEKINDKSSGAGELAGESLDREPDDKSFEDDMKKGGFSDKDISDMKKSKKEDLSGEIDDEKVAKEAAAEMDKKCREKTGDKHAVSSLSRTILRSITKEKLTQMEWKKMVEMFLKSKSPIKGHVAKSTKTGWGDKKHLWREAVLPKKTPSGGDVRMISCFVDFSGSVSQPLVFTFLNKVLKLCDKFTYTEVNVYGFGDKLSTPRKVTGKEIKSRDTEELIKEIWSFIQDQTLGGSIENFNVVADEINRIKRKDFDAAILIFGDGMWAVSYGNPEPPIRLKEKCRRFLKDILCLIYYPKGNKYYEPIISSEITYLKDVADIKNVVTTPISELKD